MKNVTAKISLVVLLSLAASIALGQNNQGQNNNNQGQNVVRAPEINPAEAMAALTLLGGAVAIVRGYRRRKK